jgi:hypothetical protein
VPGATPPVGESVPEPAPELGELVLPVEPVEPVGAVVAPVLGDDAEPVPELLLGAVPEVAPLPEVEPLSDPAPSRFSTGEPDVPVPVLGVVEPVLDEVEPGGGVVVVVAGTS